MRNALLAARLVTVLVAAAGSVPLVVSDGARAAEGSPTQGSARYECQSEGSAAAEPTPVSFDLNVPASSVRPGDVVSLSGKLRITFSDAEAEKSELTLAGEAKIDATDFEFVVRAGGETVRLEPLSLTSAPKPVSTPFKLTAQVAYPDLTIPESTSGAVVIEMPVAHTASTDVAGAPAEVTFNARVKQDSLLVPEREFACWAEKPKSREIIARLPVVAESGDGDAPSDTDGSAAAPDLPPGSHPAASGVSASGADPSAPGLTPQADVPASSTAAPPAAADAAESNVLASAPVPPASVSDDTFIPGWILALFIALFPAAAIAYAVKQRRRFRDLVATSTTR